MNIVVLVSLLGRSALGAYLVTRKSSVAKGFGILALGSVAVSGAALLELKRRGVDLFAANTGRGDGLLAPSSKPVPTPSPKGDGLMKPSFAGYFGYAG